MFTAFEFVRRPYAMFVRTLTELVSVENGGLYASV